MLKAVISPQGTPPVQASTYLESTENAGSDTNIFRTKLLQDKPFFQNPHAQKLEKIETDLRNILSSSMSSEQKGILYQEALNKMFIADRQRKANVPAPAPLRGRRRRQPRPPPQLPQPPPGPPTQPPQPPPEAPVLPPPALRQVFPNFLPPYPEKMTILRPFPKRDPLWVLPQHPLYPRPHPPLGRRQLAIMPPGENPQNMPLEDTKKKRGRPRKKSLERSPVQLRSGKRGEATFMGDYPTLDKRRKHSHDKRRKYDTYIHDSSDSEEL